MTLKLYIYPGEENRVNKTSLLDEEVTLTGTLRDSCDILNPSIIVETLSGYTISTSDGDDVVLLDDDDLEVPVIAPGDAIINNTETILKYTYAYIPEFNRYYFITNITSIRQNLWMISMRVDVLMSYKTEILTQSGMVARNENTYNLDLVDDRIPYEYDLTVTESDVTNLTTVTELSPISVDADSVFNIRITVINDRGYDRNVIASPVSPLPSVQYNYTGLSNFAHVYIMNLNQVGGLASESISGTEKASIASFVTSIVAYPFEFPVNNSSIDLRVGTTDVSTVGVREPYQDNPLSPYFLIADFEITRTYNDFRDFSPYTQYELYLPYISYVTLDSNLVVGKRLKVYYSVAGDDGTVQITIVADGKVIFSEVSQVGVPIPLNQTNHYEIQTNRLRLVSSLVAGVTGGLGQAVGAVGTMSSGNTEGGIGKAIGAGASIGTSINNFITGTMDNRPQGRGSIGGGAGGHYLPQKVRLRKTTRKTTITSFTDYAKLYGRPLSDVKAFSTLSGFTIVSSVHLESLSSLPGEKAQIESLLYSGVIF